MNIKKVIIPVVVVSVVVFLVAGAYFLIYQGPKEDSFNTTNLYKDSNKDTTVYDTKPVDSTNNGTDLNTGFYKSSDLSAKIPESWILLDTLGTEIIAATNIDETIQF